MITFETTKLGFSVFKKKRYRHKLVPGKCVRCGSQRPVACECVVQRQYTYNQMRDDYQQQCTGARMDARVKEIAEKVQDQIDRAIMWGDISPLLNKQPTIMSSTPTMSEHGRRGLFGALRESIYVRTKK